MKRRISEAITKELKTIVAALDEHDPDLTIPMLQAVVNKLADYFGGGKESTLIWHLRQFRNEAMIHDAKEASE